MRVIVTAGSDEKCAKCRDLGAEVAARLPDRADGLGDDDAQGGRAERAKVGGSGQDGAKRQVRENVEARVERRELLCEPVEQGLAFVPFR